MYLSAVIEKHHVVMKFTRKYVNTLWLSVQLLCLPNFWEGDDNEKAEENFRNKEF